MAVGSSRPRSREAIPDSAVPVPYVRLQEWLTALKWDLAPEVGQFKRYSGDPDFKDWVERTVHSFERLRGALSDSRS